jgi:predicted outer membrane protein
MAQEGRRGAQLPTRDEQDTQLRQFAQDPKTAADKMFVLHAGMGNQFEIELAKAVQQKAQNAQVKQLAQHIADDHQKANEQLQRVAQQLSVRIPQTLPDEKREMIQILTSLPVDEMEKHFTTAMQADHASELIKYRACAQMSQNQAIKEYAQQQLPALSQHYDQSQQTAVALGLPSGGQEAMPASGRIPGRTGDNITPGSSGSTGTQNPSGSSGNNTNRP